MEDLTEEGIKAALRRLTENTRRMRLELLGQMRRPAGSNEEGDTSRRARRNEIRGAGSDSEDR